MSKHTSRPWVIFVDRSESAEKFDILPAGRPGEIAANIRNEADALLFRAAPELLEAARALVDEIREHGTHQCWKGLANAVTLAEGEES